MSLVKLFQSLNQEVQATISQCKTLNDKVVVPLKDASFKFDVFEQLYDVKLEFDSDSHNNLFEQLYQENLRFMLEKYKATTNFSSQVFDVKSNFARLMFSCMAKSFESIVQESWEDYFHEFEDIVNDFNVPDTLFESVNELRDFYRLNLDQNRFQEFMDLIKELPEELTEMNDRLGTSMRGLMKKVKNMDANSKESMSDLRRTYKALMKQESKRKNEYQKKFKKVNELLPVVSTFYDKLVQMNKELQSDDVKNFHKVWSALEVFMEEADERLEKMFEIPRVLQLVYAKNDNNINTLMLTVRELKKNLKKLKPIWKLIYKLRKNETLENVEDVNDLIQMLSTGWPDHQECINSLHQEMIDLKRDFKATDAFTAVAENMAEKKKQLSDKITKMFDHKTETSEERKRRKEQEKKEKKLAKENSKMGRRIEKKMEKRLKDTEGVSSQKVLLRGVENIGKDIATMGNNVDVVTPVNNAVNGVKGGLSGLGSKIKALGRKDILKTGLLGGVFGNNNNNHES